MTTCRAFIATGLDGFIARRTGEIDWLGCVPTDGEARGFEAVVASVDGLIMGRHTYEAALSCDRWPQQEPIVVLSMPLRQSGVPARIAERGRISTHAPGEIMAVVAREGWKRADVDDSRLIQSFLRAGLIEDLIIARIPVLLHGERGCTHVSHPQAIRVRASS